MNLSQDTYGMSLILDNIELFDVNPKIADIVIDILYLLKIQDIATKQMIVQKIVIE